MRQVSSLTGLRGVAALWVLLFHLTLAGPGIGALWLSKAPWLSAGWIGVDLFFVLSGFILMWVHSAEFVRPTFPVIRRFAALRLVRVYPPSLVVLGLIGLLVLVDPVFVAASRASDPDNFSAGALLRTAALATRWVNTPRGEWNEPVWSLSVELVGYAAFPLLAWGLARRSFATALMVAGIALMTLAAYQITTGTVGVNMINRLSALVRMACCFTAGVAVCRMRQAVPAGVARHAPAAALAICAALAVCVLFRAGFLLPPLLFAGLIFCLSFQAGVVDRWFSSGPAMLLGKISFPLYLLHITPLAWIEAHLRGARLGQAAATGVLAAYVTACLVAAYLLHRAVEQPLHRWARQGFPLPRLGSRSRVMSLDPIDPNS